MRIILMSFTLAVCLTALSLTVPIQVHGQTVSQSPVVSDSSATPARGLMQVNPMYVCMITNRYFEEKQIPTSVEGRTYYGCCSMCVQKLNENPKSRTTTDPVTGREIDKANAIIGAFPNGDILYFESEETLQRYKPENEKSAGNVAGSDY